MFKQAKEIYLLYYCDLTIKLKGFLLLFPPPFFEAFKNEIVWDFETSSSSTLLSSANYLTVFESDLHSMKGAHNSYETRSYDLVVDNFSIWNVKRMWKKYGIPADKILVELHLLKNLGILICICINMYVLIYLHFVIGQFILG